MKDIFRIFISSSLASISSAFVRLDSATAFYDPYFEATTHRLKRFYFVLCSVFSIIAYFVSFFAILSLFLVFQHFDKRIQFCQFSSIFVNFRQFLFFVNFCRFSSIFVNFCQTFSFFCYFIIFWLFYHFLLFYHFWLFHHVPFILQQKSDFNSVCCYASSVQAW